MIGEPQNLGKLSSFSSCELSLMKKRHWKTRETALSWEVKNLLSFQSLALEMLKKEKFSPNCVFYQRTSKKQKQWNWIILLSFQFPSPKDYHMSKEETILYSDSDWRRELTQNDKFFEQALTTYNNESGRKAGMLGWEGGRNSDGKDGDGKGRIAWKRELLVIWYGLQPSFLCLFSYS